MTDNAARDQSTQSIFCSTRFKLDTFTRQMSTSAIPGRPSVDERHRHSGYIPDSRHSHIDGAKASPRARLKQQFAVLRFEDEVAKADLCPSSHPSLFAFHFVEVVHHFC